MLQGRFSAGCSVFGAAGGRRLVMRPGFLYWRFKTFFNQPKAKAVGSVHLGKNEVSCSGLHQVCFCGLRRSFHVLIDIMECVATCAGARQCGWAQAAAV